MPTTEHNKPETDTAATAANSASDHDPATLEEIRSMLTESAKRETAIIGMITEMRQALTALKAEVDKKSDKEDVASREELERAKNIIKRIDSNLMQFEKGVEGSFRSLARGVGGQSADIQNKIVEGANHVVSQTKALLNYAEARLAQKVEDKGEEIDRHVESLHVKLDQKF